jgi:hypothetical protein
MFLLEVIEVEAVFVLAGKGDESLDEAEVELRETGKRRGVEMLLNFAQGLHGLERGELSHEQLLMKLSRHCFYYAFQTYY